MKKLLALFLAVIFLVSLAGCNASQTNAPDGSQESSETKDTILKAWTGEFSEEKLTEAIHEYQNNYANIVLGKNDKTVSFETDFEISSCVVSRLSSTLPDDINKELTGYIDFAPETRYDGNQATISVDWWYNKGASWVNEYLVWSYLVWLKDTNGNTYYYYFRTDYSAFQ